MASNLSTGKLYLRSHQRQFLRQEKHMKMHNSAVNYSAGAVTALSYMAEIGVSKQDVLLLLK